MRALVCLKSALILYFEKKRSSFKRRLAYTKNLKTSAYWQSRHFFEKALWKN